MIRAKITPKIDEEGMLHVLIEWIEVENETPLSTLFQEEFRLAPERFGSAYVSRATFSQGNIQEGTFWLDSEDKRHFVVRADPGSIGLLGGSAG